MMNAKMIHQAEERSNKEQESECTSLQQPRYAGSIVPTESRI